MKRCPKCNRSYPDDNQKFCTLDGGLLMSADQGFDPNATILSTSTLNESTPAPPPVDLNRTVASLPPPPPAGDVNRTVALPSSGPTEILDRHTGPTGGETVIDRPAPSASSQPQHARVPQHSTAATPATAAVAPAKKSKAPMIIGLLLLLLVHATGREEFDDTTRRRAGRIVGITACPTGIAHTFMAAEALLAEAPTAATDPAAARHVAARSLRELVASDRA